MVLHRLQPLAAESDRRRRIRPWMALEPHFICGAMMHGLRNPLWSKEKDGQNGLLIGTIPIYIAYVKSCTSTVKSLLCGQNNFHNYMSFFFKFACTQTFLLLEITMTFIYYVQGI